MVAKKSLLVMEFKSLKIRSLTSITPISKGSGKGASGGPVITSLAFFFFFNLSPKSFEGVGKETKLNPGTFNTVLKPMTSALRLGY